jgi:hypothetical protein
MPRGRPPNSPIRDRMTRLLEELGPQCGYNLYKEYVSRFPKVTMRVVYYHLNKGVELGIFVVDDVRIENGNYSWGTAAKKIYYSLSKAFKEKKLEI